MPTTLIGEQVTIKKSVCRISGGMYIPLTTNKTSDATNDDTQETEESSNRAAGGLEQRLRLVHDG